jgi:lipopolysaccharide/colanic/teichoic acid biosynthesis glycosyltransferase
MLLETFCVASGGLVVYHHALYPFALRRFAQSYGVQRSASHRSASVETPTISVVVPAFNEARLIERKIENIAAIDYPADKLTAFIVCDGCTDDTVELARRKISELGPKGQIFRLVVHEANRGKVAVLNETIAAINTALVALTDASAELASADMRRAARHFSDPRVGVVTGRYEVPGADPRADAYWNYQVKIKAAEAALGSPIGMHGAFYAFRHSAWRPLEPDTINDDVILPMRIIAEGYHGVYDQSIRILEADVDHFSVDLARRERLGAGAVQQAIRLWRLSDPRRPGLAFTFLSGKGLRAFMPVLLVIALVTNAMLARESLFFTAAFVGQVTLYGMALVGLIYEPASRVPVIGKLSYLVGGYAMSMLGAVKHYVGKEKKAWKRVIDASASGRKEAFLEEHAIRGKRVLDVAIASCALVVLGIIYIPLAIAIKLESRGPIFYRQLRVGLRSANRSDLFYLTKFRTMRTDAEAKTGAVWASTDDPRVTRIGRFLRKSRLDELPQCFDVLRGDMSIVGPRPERPQFFSWLETEIPFYAERTYGLKPGITGLAQVKLPYDSSIEDVRAKVLHDHAYALQLAAPGSWLWTDISIMLRTFTVMVLGKGR